MIARSLLATVYSVTVCLTMATADDDPIRKTLDAAKRKYEQEVEKLNKDVAVWFDKRDEIARKDGNKKLVEQIKEDRQKFEDTRDFYRVSSANLKQRNSMLRAEIEAAYRQAIKDFIKAKKDDEAALLEKEFLELRLRITTPDEIEAMLVGIWRVVHFDAKGKEVFRADWTFRKDGTVTSTKGSPRGVWTIEKDKQRVHTKWEGSDEPWETFALPLSPTKTTGESFNGWRKEARKIK